ncbi:protein kinase [Streptomyces sp. NPDC000594]|uniref:serine/threonine-protein kinase n=1 Tax=Streptomyces sp. NPDC000594 TaxID=3154261 RepID=UPI0033281B2A
MNAWTVPGYTDSRELGSGTSGRVVLAVHEATGVPVAIKYLAERLRRDHSFVVGLRSEARLLAALGSPHVVGLYEYVESPDGAAIVMELVDGVSLRVLLREEGATGPEAALVVLKGSLLGLSSAHGAGVVHRDYKPENVLVRADGVSKLADFGIATGLGDEPEVAGTPSYMAPEQWQGAVASPTADVYAATVTFFECLTGHKPYSAGNLAELAVAHMSAPVPDEEAPEPLRPLIARGLAKDPGDRPASASVFLAELEEIARSAYGEAWEERGQHRLAALVALFPLLLPSAEGPRPGGPETATTAFGRRKGPRTGLRAAGPVSLAARFAGRGAGRGTARGTGAMAPVAGRSARREALWTAGSLCAAAAAAAGLFALMVAVEPDSTGSAGAAGRYLATTSADPSGTPTASPPGEPTVTPGARPGRSPAASDAAAGIRTPRASAPAPGTPAAGVPSRSGPPAPTRSPSAGRPVDPPPRTTPPPTRTTPPSTPPKPSPSETTPAPSRVRSVQISSLEQTSGSGRIPGSSVSVTFEVTTDGTGPVTLVLTWYSGDVPGELGEADTVETLSRSGARTYTVTVPHVYTGDGCYLAVVASAAPAPSGGETSGQILDRRCASHDESQTPS